jgi:hypothetical protein
MRFPFFSRKISTAPVSANYDERLEALEERWKEIETEWTDWYEKFRLLHLRLAKRQQAIERAEATTASVEPDKAQLTLPSGGSPEPPSNGMSDEQRAWQQKILRQRARI